MEDRLVFLAPSVSFAGREETLCNGEGRENWTCEEDGLDSYGLKVVSISRGESVCCPWPALHGMFVLFTKHTYLRVKYIFLVEMCRGGLRGNQTGRFSVST